MHQKLKINQFLELDENKHALLNLELNFQKPGINPKKKNYLNE